MMKHSTLEIREHLVKYIKRYNRAVKYVGKDFLTRKGLTLKDYLDFMSVPGNRGDELSLYLAARMCSKQVAVITKNDIWYTGKLDNDEEAFISLDDVDLVLIYIGKNVFRATKPKPVLIHQTPEPEVKSPSTKDTDYLPSKVYEPESALPRQHTRSMGSPTPTIESDTEPASEVHSSPQATPEKSKAHRHRCRKCTQIVIKQKEFKIC